MNERKPTSKTVNILAFVESPDGDINPADGPRPDGYTVYLRTDYDTPDENGATSKTSEEERFDNLIIARVYAGQLAAMHDAEVEEY